MSYHDWHVTHFLSALVLKLFLLQARGSLPESKSPMACDVLMAQNVVVSEFGKTEQVGFQDSGLYLALSANV